MKKILLIGKQDTYLAEMNEYLHNFFRVLICNEETQNAPAMVRVVMPDLVLVILSGVYDVDMSIFTLLREQYPRIPVLTLGSGSEYRNFSGVFGGASFENLLLPLGKEDILMNICRRLNITLDQLRADPKAAASGAVPDYRKHVLVVDDNAMTLRNLKACLDTMYRVTLANSGTKAITSIGKDRPDLILLDYEMPVCDGRQTLEMIRSDEEIRDIPVIFLTSVQDREHIEAVLKLNPSGYMLKPPVQEKLIDTIESVLARR